MFLEISNKGINYHERLHRKELKDSSSESIDELILLLFKLTGPISPEDFMEEIISRDEPEDEREKSRKVLKRVFEAGYIKEVE